MAMLTVREIEPADIELIIKYWLEADAPFLLGMGVDLSKLPDAPQWRQMLSAQISQPYQEKQSYCIIWELDGHAVGHCNVNSIVFGKEAYMHLHLWGKTTRQNGMGTALVKLTLPYFFQNLQLKTLYCQPYSLNPAPNKTLEKVGFQFEKTYRTVPGYLNFEQDVNLWRLNLDQFHQTP